MNPYCLTVICIIVFICFSSCKAGGIGDDECVEYDKVVALLEAKFESVAQDDFDAYSLIHYSESEHIKKLNYETNKSIYELSRMIFDRVGVEELEKYFGMGAGGTYRGVFLLDRLFWGDWKNKDKMVFNKYPEYQGVEVRVMDLSITYLVVCIDGELKFDLDTQLALTEQRLRVVEIAAKKTIERNDLLMNEIEKQDVKSLEELDQVMAMKDWKIRVDLDEIE